MKLQFIEQNFNLFSEHQNISLLYQDFLQKSILFSSIKPFNEKIQLEKLNSKVDYDYQKDFNRQCSKYMFYRDNKFGLSWPSG